MQILQSIQNRIYELRGERVMLDFDLAAMYEVETKRLTETVKRNLKRFPEDFMFRLSVNEWQSLKSQFVTSSENLTTSRFQIETLDDSLRSQFATSKGRGGTIYLPYAFIEQGVAMLSGILNSDRAINMNIAIMRAFVEIRKIVFQQNDLK